MTLVSNLKTKWSSKVSKTVVTVFFFAPSRSVAHLQCAGQELPLSREDENYFGPLMHDICAARLWKDKDGW